MDGRRLALFLRGGASLGSPERLEPGGFGLEGGDEFGDDLGPWRYFIRMLWHFVKQRVQPQQLIHERVSTSPTSDSHLR